MRRLLLWDIDGTLLTTKGVTQEAFHDAVGLVLGRTVQTDVAFYGKTDPIIARELLEACGVPSSEIETLARRVLRTLGPQMALLRKEMSEKGEVLPGVRELLTRLEDEAVLSTVLTGNLAVNAVLKLDTFKLTSYFDIEVGAFGSDRTVRSELVDVACNRADRLRNVLFEDDEIWIIGDTPRDFEAARANDIKCALVATGAYGYDELAALEPDLLMHNLLDAKRFYEVVLDQKLIDEVPVD